MGQIGHKRYSFNMRPPWNLKLVYNLVLFTYLLEICMAHFGEMLPISLAASEEVKIYTGMQLGVGKIT